MDCRVRAAACIVLAVLLLSILARWTESTTGGYDTTLSKAAQRLVTQSRRWDAAARQDSDPLMALAHTNYALAYLEIATQLLPEAEVERATGHNVRSMTYSVEKHQAAMMAALGGHGGVAVPV
jgi:hypothetical protein